MLVLVLAVLMVSFASSFRAYLQQRQQLGRLDDQIASSKANLTSLEREQKRWRDPAFVKAQARKQFGFLMPGEIGYTVLGADGKPLGDVDTLDDPATKTDDGKPEWYSSLWSSVLLAGNPPTTSDEPAPATEIKPPSSKKAAEKATGR
ncbi:MAG: septum formation initiator family protein [Nocardioidaceae bacterium]